MISDGSTGVGGGATGLASEVARLRERINDAYARGSDDATLSGDLALFAEFLELLNAGHVRAAEPHTDSAHGWRVNAWVKRGILLGFRVGVVEHSEVGGVFRFSDKNTFPPKRTRLGGGSRVVPGGSTVREGAYIGERVTCMPPMYVNVGAWVGDDTMVDSHALIGSCAQVGRQCHISAAAQVGGVLEPIGALPVIVEDAVLVGGNSGLYEGTIVKQGAVVGAGVVLTRSTPVYDIARGEVIRAERDGPLVIPERAVVVPGSRPIKGGMGEEWGLSLYAPVIVKYRDDATEDRTQLEADLR